MTSPTRLRNCKQLAHLGLSAICAAWVGLSSAQLQLPTPQGPASVSITTAPQVLPPAVTSSTLSGVVRWAGAIPVPEPFEVNVDERYCAPRGELPNEQTAVDPKTLAVRNAVVWLEPLNGDDLPTSTPPPAGFDPFRMEVKECRFSPEVLVLPEDTRLWITSRDPILHELRIARERGREHTFFLGHNGALQTLRLREPGTYTVRCRRHPWERAAVVVTDHAYFAVTDETGAFSFAEVLPGPYRVHAWHDGLYAVPKKEVGLVKEYEFSRGPETSAYVRLPNDAERPVILTLTEAPPATGR